MFSAVSSYSTRCIAGLFLCSLGVESEITNYGDL